MAYLRRVELDRFVIVSKVKGIQSDQVVSF